MKKIIPAFIIFLFSLQSFAFDVFVSIAPLQYFVKEIAKGRVQIHTMVKPGASPAVYEPSPSQMKQLMSAKIYFAVGVPYEKAWLSKLSSSNKDMMVAHTDKGIQKHRISAHSHGESHGDEHGDAHDGESLDPHIWLDPILAIKIAENVTAALGNYDPLGNSFYKKNLIQLKSNITSVHNMLEKTLEPVKGSKFMVFHPSWGYFAERYGLTQIAVESEGKEPKAKDLIRLINEAKEEKIKVILVAPQFSRKAAATIAKQTGAEMITADPLSAFWEQSLVSVANVLSENLK